MTAESTDLPEDPPPKPRGEASASSLVAGGILLSRIAGFVRDRATAAYFGTSLYGDVVRAGLRMPNILQNLLGEGTLSASFIPVYSELLHEGRKEEAGRVAGAVFALLLALAGLLSVLGVIFAAPLTDLLLPGFEGERRELTISLTRIIFPMTGTLVLAAWALGILNSHRKFFVPYFAPVLWNAAIIAALLLYGGRLDTGGLVLAFGWGALAGGVIQLGIQLPWVLKLERDLRIRWDTRMPPVREAIRNAGPAIMGRGVVQLSGYIDFVLASLLATGALAAIGYAMTIYILPVSLFGMSVAAAELPELSRQRTASPDQLRARTNAALQRIAFYIVPSFAAMIVLGDLIVAALYQTGEFDRQATLLVYLTLAGYTTGLLASTATRLFSSTFFALRDTRTPARTATVRVISSAVLGFLFMVQFEAVNLFGLVVGPGLFAGVRLGDQPLGAVGLGLSAGLAAWIEWFQLRRALRARIGRVGASAAAVSRMFAAAGLAAAAGWGIRAVLPPLHPFLAGMAVFSGFGLVYFVVAALLGLAEAEGLKTRLGGAFRRFR